MGGQHAWEAMCEQYVQKRFDELMSRVGQEAEAAAEAAEVPARLPGSTEAASSEDDPTKPRRLGISLRTNLRSPPSYPPPGVDRVTPVPKKQPCDKRLKAAEPGTTKVFETQDLTQGEDETTVRVVALMTQQNAHLEEIVTKITTTNRILDVMAEQGKRDSSARVEQMRHYASMTGLTNSILRALQDQNQEGREEEGGWQDDGDGDDGWRW